MNLWSADGAPVQGGVVQIPIRLTQNGAVAGTPGSISNLTSPASVAYNSANFTATLTPSSSLAASTTYTLSVEP